MGDGGRPSPVTYDLSPINEVVAQRVRGDDGAPGLAADAQAVVDVLDVPLDGPDAEGELFGDLAVAEPLGDQRDDLLLARGQRVRRDAQVPDAACS